MDLFTYLMAKKGHNTHRDLFSYLLGKKAGGSGTYTTFSGTSLNISNTLQAKIKNIVLEGNASQDGDPTPDTPIPIKVVTGEQNVEIKNSDSTLSQNYPLSLGNIELFRNYTDETKIYTDYIFKNEIGSPYYNSSLDENSWYKYNRNKKIELKNYNYTSSVTKRTNTILFLGAVTGKVHSKYYCNILSSYHYNTLINSDIEGIGHGGGYANRLYISVNKDRLEGYTDELTNSQLNTLLKQFLESNNAYAWYALSTPTYDKITDTTLIGQLESLNNAHSYKETTIIECTSESTDNEIIVFSGEIKVTSANLDNSLNTSLLSSNLQEETNIDEIEEQNLDEIEEQNDEPIENEETEEPIEEEVS